MTYLAAILITGWFAFTGLACVIMGLRSGEPFADRLFLVSIGGLALGVGAALMGV